MLYIYIYYTHDDYKIINMRTENSVRFIFIFAFFYSLFYFVLFCFVFNFVQVM